MVNDEAEDAALVAVADFVEAIVIQTIVIRVAVDFVAAALRGHPEMTRFMTI